MKLGTVAVAVLIPAALSGQQKKKSVEVPLPMSVTAATSRVMVAAARSGLMVASNEGGVLTLAPYEIPDFRPPIMMTIRVNLVPVDSTSLAIVGGNWSNAAIANIQKHNPMASAWSSEGVAEEGGKAYIGAAFKEVEKFANAIKASQ